MERIVRKSYTDLYRQIETYSLFFGSTEISTISTIPTQEERNTHGTVSFLVRRNR